MSFNSINKATILGRLGRDPEIRTMTDGKKVVSFSVATSTTWIDKAGEKKETVEWHNIVVFNEATVNFIESYVKKGSKIYIEGKIKTRKFITKKTGQEQYTTEIIVSGFDSRVILLDSMPSNLPPKIDDYESFFKQEEKKPRVYDNNDIPDMDDFIPF